MEPCKLAFMPYHYLLVTANKLGFIKYLDVSLGKEVAECKTKRGEPTGMVVNKQNGVLATGHANGEVCMWTPNMASKPVVKLLSHIGSPVSSLSISSCGKYMATTGKDSRFKIWDIRQSFKCLYDYFTPSPASHCDFSDTGLVSVSFGNEVQIWKNTTNEKQKTPYMKHRLQGANRQAVIQSCKFAPFEDVLGLVHDNGYSSILVPGSGIANFDAYEANPFETSKQRRERQIHGLLEKLDPQTISLKIDTIGDIDTAAPEVREQETKEMMEAQIEQMRKQEKKAKKKMRGKNKIGNKMASSTRQQHEAIRESNKL